MVGNPAAPVFPPGKWIPGDHAGRLETSIALALFPERVDMKALGRPHDAQKLWPLSGRPASAKPTPISRLGQHGEDPHLANPRDVQPAITATIDHIVSLINRRLGRA